MAKGKKSKNAEQRRITANRRAARNPRLPLPAGPRSLEANQRIPEFEPVVGQVGPNASLETTGSPPPPFQPNPSNWSGTNWVDAAVARDSTLMHQRNAALLDSGSQVLPPPEHIAPPRGDPPAREISINRTNELATRNSAAAPSPEKLVVQTTRISRAFRDNAERAELLARALSTSIRNEIERLKGERRNDLERQAQIDFLEVISATLNEIADVIHEARQAATPQDREQKFAEAETLARRLAKAGRDFAERNYDRITDYGGYSVLVILGTQLFVSLFGVPVEEAVAAQLALLGLSGAKK